jgi:hypothetical protein
MLGSGKLYEAEKRENGKNLATFGLIEIFIGIVALIVAVVMLFSSKDAFSGDFTYIVSYLPSFIIPIAFIIFGAIEIYNVNKEK